MHLLSWARFLNPSNTETPSAQMSGDAWLGGGPGAAHSQVFAVNSCHLLGRKNFDNANLFLSWITNFKQNAYME